ncbi:7957_t:CDS:2 [Racocetra fulgida]|uniref:7957_t:CDS:1 n=1 Tax=Racocetra fulgida TaxID=60492 RepID=A0A9N9G389_9GLOM|nr:7957_t:CDS:2 [Racocetra fulgida]
MNAMNDEGSRKRHRLSLENNEEFSSEVEEDTRTTITTTTDTSNSQFSQISTVIQPSSSKNMLQNKHKSRVFSEVWDYFVKGSEKTNGHYEATSQLEAHLSNEYASCPDDISHYWCKKVAESDINYIRRPKTSSALPNSKPQTTMTSYYMSDRSLTKAITSCLDQKLSFFGKELTESKLRNACNIASVGNVMNCEDDQMRVNSENSLDNIVSDHPTTLLIEDIVDLTVENNSERSERTAQTISPADLDYDPLDVLNSFLERENQNNNQ